ncbi:MFS transporter [Klebsiella quasipneumoniae]|uniref:MFS transporter n=1 Tax=Klebsiella quasipneumoniae TaxID=1463165 RepID=UPI001C828742|nr:MFS transporter [Klebsiella quasipneumoniae]MBX4843025.1 MFS transporter [Klebsiella quasipneumoniae]MCJ1849890.1 MFS transporter [Klebsiella quasipneumoniae subsp. similipneumoniae]MEB5998012.1 MFS transporter [Klebsiella quasipneumoniae]HBR1991293.1 MFS transporter [Klebsiella quasipneumoniae subsp. similipneumoniae]HCI6117700.1 MFS transporter [Klebsiella quasipneumoniae subsp. similipneumoniae]
MNQNPNPLTLKLKLREKVAYGIGDLGSNLMLSIGTLYLLKFYTDELGIPAIYGGIIFLVAKFFTAFTDMLTGIILDSRRNIGERGKFRPFILYFAVPVALVATAQFIANDFDLTVKTALATVLFMLFGLFYSLMNCSYGAMVPAITKNPQERAHLAAWRQGGATIGLLLCTVGFMPIQRLFSSNSSLGYTVAALLFVTCGLFCMWCCYKGVKERYVEATVSTQKSGVMASFCTILNNPPLLVLCIANLCTLAAFNIKLVIQVYYVQYVLNDIQLLSWMGFFSMGCILIGVLLVPYAVSRFGKKRVYIGGLLLWAIGDVLNFAFGTSSLLFIIFSCVAFFGTAFVNSLNWALVPDTVEYGEWKTGNRAEGAVYTGFTFSRKISAALAGFLPGMMLTQIGYVPHVVQSEATLLGLRQLIFLWPSALTIVAVLIMGTFYKLNEKNFTRIVATLERRKNAANPPTNAEQNI